MNVEPLLKVQRRRYAAATTGLRAAWPESAALDGRRMAALLTRHRHCVLATARLTGAPHAPPVAFVVARIVEYGTGKALSALLPKKGGDRRLLLYFGETVYSALYDYNDQPFFKSFLRLETRDGAVKVYCVGVADEELATVEDHVSWDPVRKWSTVRTILGPANGGGVVGEVDYYRHDSDGGEPLLVFDLGDASAEYWVHLRQNKPHQTGSQNEDEGWEPAGRLHYDERGSSHTVFLPPPNRGWFSDVGLSRVDGSSPAPPTPNYAVGAFV
jgi:hypothetical protein